MKIVNALWKSSIGRKWLMSLTGLGAFGFLIAHLLGNLLYYCGPDSLNAYAKKLHELPFFHVMEIGLAIMFVLHIILSIIVSLNNSRARDHKYAVNTTAGKSTLASRTMIISGIAILLFLVIHLWTMKFGHWKALLTYDRIATVLSNPAFASLYIIGILFVGFHLSHGISSALQSLGIRSYENEKQIVLISKTIAGILTLGFLSLPLYVLLT